MDLDAPVRPIDPDDDARRLASARAARRRGAFAMLLAFANPLVAFGGGLVLGGWHARAPVVGAVGMLLAFGAAYGAFNLAGMLALAVEAPGLLRHLGTPPAARAPAWKPVARGLPWLLAVALCTATFAACAALAGVATGLLGDGGIHAIDVLAFGALGAVLGLALPLSDWS